jgi:mono/diheme cytochrome c family protein
LFPILSELKFIVSEEFINMRSKIIAKSVLVLIAVLFGLTSLTQSFYDNPVSAKSGGADVYQQNCASCHGSNGKPTAKGKRKGATDLTKSKIGDAAGIKVIINGRDSMPDFKDSLSATEIKEVMAYIRGFRK